MIKEERKLSTVKKRCIFCTTGKILMEAERTGGNSMQISKNTRCDIVHMAQYYVEKQHKSMRKIDWSMKTLQ